MTQSILCQFCHVGHLHTPFLKTVFFVMTLDLIKSLLQLKTPQGIPHNVYQILQLWIVSPNALCKDLIVYLDSNGEASITVDEIDDGSYDNCTVSKLAASNLKFTCDDVTKPVDVTLYVTDNSNNIDSCVSKITVIDPAKENCVFSKLVFTFPNAFSPNKDDLNDVLWHKNSNIEVDELKVYNRWGEQIYSYQRKGKPWDGTYMDEFVQNGLYLWVATFHSIKNSRLKDKNSGHVLVIR